MCLFVIWLSREMFYRRTAPHVVTVEECFVITGVLPMLPKTIAAQKPVKPPALQCSGDKKYCVYDTVLTLHTRTTDNVACYLNTTSIIIVTYQ